MITSTLGEDCSPALFSIASSVGSPTARSCDGSGMSSFRRPMYTGWKTCSCFLVYPAFEVVLLEMALYFVDRMSLCAYK